MIASAWVSVQLGSIASGWQVVLQIGAGTGAVYILRWYWWRINAWSEISAMACSLLVTVMLNRWQPFSGNSSLVFAKSAHNYHRHHHDRLADGHLLTKPEPDEILLRFYRKVRPDVRGWKRIASRAPELGAPSRLRKQFRSLGVGLRHDLPVLVRYREVAAASDGYRTHDARGISGLRVTALSRSGAKLQSRTVEGIGDGTAANRLKSVSPLFGSGTFSR